MRVTFFEPGEQTLSSNRKGVLFERLARRVVEASGYEQVELRRIHNSLEYDIEGVAALTRRKLVGEAKALERNIEGQVISSFVGKLLPLAQTEPVDGLFISVSPFTPDASDYLDSVRPALEPLTLGLTTLVGGDIPPFLGARRGHVSEDVIRERVAGLFELQAFDVWLVVTERDDFFVATCGPNLIQTPTHYATFGVNGSELQLEPETLERLQTQLGLAGLAPATVAGQGQLSPRAERLPSVDVGAGWFDYRFPAPPDCFIGRASALDEVATTLAEIERGATALRAIQILSRSGVGKSSLLLKLQAELPHATTITIDARSLTVPSEIRLVAASLVEAVNRDLGIQVVGPRSQDEAAAALERVGAEMRKHNRVAVVQLDQFESTLARPLVFAAALDLVSASTSQGVPIVWIFARKNDLSVTFDQGARVDLERLNIQSKAIALDDFSAPESTVLLDRLAEELGQPLRRDLAEAISTFSAGFPWLHKRLCAHVLSMQSEGIAQDELVQQGLRAEDLFEEDMAGLGEADKALLRRIAAELPASGEELARSLESEVSPQRLREVLNEFLSQKLLRLSGDVYDTYNDVFKTYLVTNQVPFKSRYIFRTSPRAALRLLPEIAQVGQTTTAALQARLGGQNRIAVLNKLRELKLLGLIDSQRGNVSLTPEGLTALEADQLGELLRSRLRGNALVVRVLDMVSARDSVTLEEIAAELRTELPHVDVADSTWRLYARQLAAWLDHAGLAYIEGDTLGLREFPAEDTLRGREFYGARFVPNTFMPSVRPKRVVELMEALRAGEISDRADVYARWGSQEAPGLLRDAATLDLIELDEDLVRVAAQGSILFQRSDTITELDLAQLALTKPNVKALAAAANEGPIDEAGQREVVRNFGSASWTDGTWRWRMGILRAWIVASGQIRSKRGRLERVRQARTSENVTTTGV